ncbi:MAG: hypothetical protein RLZZ612_86 [Pseudomonadota bacterium]|jgi:hypothetical protein
MPSKEAKTAFEAAFAALWEAIFVFFWLFFIIKTAVSLYLIA